MRVPKQFPGIDRSPTQLAGADGNVAASINCKDILRGVASVAQTALPFAQTALPIAAQIAASL